VKRHALQLLETELCRTDVDCALVTETWFTSKHLSQYVAIEGYNIFRRDRSRRDGGGVCVYIKNSIDCSVVSFTDSPTPFEKIWVTFKYFNQVYYVACCYHPPAPRYRPADFIDDLTNELDTITRRADILPVVIVAGDFNGLKTDFLEEYCGLTLIVHDITHGKKVLDKVFINHPDMFNACVYRSLLKTKHNAVLISNETHIARQIVKTERKRVKVYDVRSHAIDRLRAAINDNDWTDVYSAVDVTDMYSLFLEKCKLLIEYNIPARMVTLGPRDPDFVTPLIKSLLRTRNKLRRRGKLEQANVLAAKINLLIAQERSRTLARLDRANPKQLWSAVKKVNGSSQSTVCHPLLRDIDSVNDFFANISYDSNYNELRECHQLPQHENDSISIEPYEIERCLKRIKPTSAGPDGLPRWLFHDCSVELCEVIAHVVSRSLACGIVPQQWKNAFVSPVQKTSIPAALSDYRPISVTSILARFTEKIVVRKWLLPSVPDCYIDDQFAFRPTGSTTCALVYMMHNITEMLETNAYVRCLCVDFSKAFDIVDHGILAAKLDKLSLPPAILQWIISFLTGRTQQVKFNGLSTAKPINRGTVQGSGIGPTNYIIMASDLRALSRFINKLFKYADDTTLLVPQHTDVQLNDEFESLKHWAEINKMILNTHKTKEIIFRRPDPCLYEPPLLLEDIERVTCVKLLGVYISEMLRFDEHVKYILTVCGQRCYLLKTLRWQGLSSALIDTIYQSIVLSRLTYALSAWGGFLSKQLINKIDAFLSRSHRFRYMATPRILNDILTTVDNKLYKSVCKPGHCLNSLVPSVRTMPMTLRNVNHLLLPQCHYMLFKNSFIIRTAFNNSY